MLWKNECNERYSLPKLWNSLRLSHGPSAQSQNNGHDNVGPKNFWLTQNVQLCNAKRQRSHYFPGYGKLKSWRVLRTFFPSNSFFRKILKQFWISVKLWKKFGKMSFEKKEDIRSQVKINPSKRSFSFKIRTLKFMHSKGVLHLDIHPGNIMTKGANVFLFGS